jgi:hypothetical protein
MYTEQQVSTSTGASGDGVNASNVINLQRERERRRPRPAENPRSDPDGTVLNNADWDGTFGPLAVTQILDVMDEILDEEARKRFIAAGGQFGVDEMPARTPLRQRFFEEILPVIEEQRSTGNVDVQDSTIITQMVGHWMSTGQMPSYTQKIFERVGKQLKVYPGVEMDLLPDEAAFMAKYHPNLHYETGVITAGVANVLRETSLYKSGKLTVVEGATYVSPDGSDLLTLAIQILANPDYKSLITKQR